MSKNSYKEQNGRLENNKKIIDILFNPNSVAVIGASKTPMKGGYRILENLISNNFKGNIYPVNPKGGEALGLKFYKSVLDIPGQIDIAIIFIPNKFIPKVLEECIEKKIKAAIIQAAGFEEVGELGLELRDRIKKITENFSKIRIVGPNCTGLTRIDTSNSGFFSAFIKHFIYYRGSTAVISQSGMLNGGYFTYLGTKYPDLGFRYIASIGNKMDLCETDFLYYFTNDPSVNVIAIYLESFKYPRDFISICKEAFRKKNKTILLLKGGLTHQGQKATSSHTGALSESIILSKALIKQSHIINVRNFHDLFNLSRVYSKFYKGQLIFPRSPNVGFITVSGGAGTVSTDLISKYGLKLSKLSENTFQTLKEIFPTWMPPNRFSLIDLWPAIENAGVDSNGIHKIAIEAILKDKKIDGLLMTLFHTQKFPFNIDIIINFQKTYRKPIFCWLFGDFNEVQRIEPVLN
ncbi:MAG: hypothetical protein GF364_13605, partial [Candidatus Lokiarchaeota archaeon]|nr:hypothetical protein [Candidatus Lokiarchaeota archaeon]